MVLVKDFFLIQNFKPIQGSFLNEIKGTVLMLPTAPGMCRLLEHGINIEQNDICYTGENFLLVIESTAPNENEIPNYEMS